MSTQVGRILGRALGIAPDLPVEGTLPSFDGATGWLNSQPLTPSGLRGRVVLVQFWTFTCINWRRTEPYTRAWESKYRDHGLVVIGVHTPEFAFEHEPDNVRREAQRMAINYPIAIDSDYGVWSAFANHYWPALYIADAQGRIRHHRFGEGDYERSEMVIRQLLAEAGVEGIPEGLVAVEGSGAEADADWADLRSPETYLGYEQATGFNAPDGVALDKPHTFTAPLRLQLNHWGLAGNWTVRSDAVALNGPNGRIAFQFHARDLHLVMGMPRSGTSARFRVLLNGEPASAAHGADVEPDGTGTATDRRMYQLIRQPKPITDRQFEIEFLDPGVEAVVFTFG